MEVRRQLIPYLRQARSDGTRAHLRYDKLIVGYQIYKLQKLKDSTSYEEESSNTNRYVKKRTVMDRSPIGDSLIAQLRKITKTTVPKN